MKVKFVLIYALAGVAFLAVSLWVFLSNGRSAKAIRYKYKLGGIMLTAWAMLSAASCDVPGPFVTCYEPVVDCYDVAMPVDMVSVSVKDYGGNRLKVGDVLVVRIEAPSFLNYRFLISASGADSIVIQTADLKIVDGKSEFEIPLAPTDFKGTANVSVKRLEQAEDGTLTALDEIFRTEIVIL